MRLAPALAPTFVLLALGLTATAEARQADRFPSADEVDALLRREPISLQTWPQWRARLLAWIPDETQGTNAAFRAAEAFCRGQARGGNLDGPLADDALAWYFLGTTYLHKDGDPELAERALRKSRSLDPKFARTHRNLAVAVLRRENPRAGEASQLIEQARQLDPSLPLKWVEAEAALCDRRFGTAERLYAEAARERPEEVVFVQRQALAIVAQNRRTGGFADAVKPLMQRFPDDGSLVVLHAVALSRDGDARAARDELQRARGMGTDPDDVVPSFVVRHIEEQAAPSLLEIAGWSALAFVVFYAVVMLLMAVVGWILAQRTRGTRALDLLGAAPDRMVSDGQVIRLGHESRLATAYAFALVAGLILFYLALPFLGVGLLAATAGLILLIFQLGRIPVKLVAVLVIAGLGGAWSVLKCMFARPASGAFGLIKSRDDCPRLYDALAEVAGRVGTDPVDEVYLAPGAGIGVHQEGRGPFGAFGVKKRVLTLGMAALQLLTVAELKSILAHEYAHFSHKDTFFSRFIYQVALSIGEAIEGLGSSGGVLTYANPVYWFLYLYHKCYGMLSAGYSRSREFLADRMAATLYGSDVFASALQKVSTDGALFEMTAYNNVSTLLDQGQQLVNTYVAFRSYRDEQLSGQEREELYQNLLAEKESLFASHPTFRERIEAVAPLPKAEQPDGASALQLFDNAEQVEQELTEFLTAYVAHVRQLQAQAEAEAQAG